MERGLNRPLFSMKFTVKEYIEFYGYTFKPGVEVDVKETTIIKKCRNNERFTEVRAKRVKHDKRGTVLKNS